MTLSEALKEAGPSGSVTRECWPKGSWVGVGYCCGNSFTVVIKTPSSRYPVDFHPTIEALTADDWLVNHYGK